MKPFIFGHRGCAYEPKNTLRSINKAIALGVDDVENLRKILKLKVDGVGSNTPDVILKYLKNKK